MGYDYYIALYFFTLFCFGGSFFVVACCWVFLKVIYSTIKGLTVFLYKVVSLHVTPEIKNTH